MSESNWLKGSKPADTPGRHDPKTHGEIPGYPVGSTFATRQELCAAAVHAPLRAGIHGTLEDGGYSIVLSYGYEDDEDDGETFIYTGHGGRDPKASKIDKMMNKESWESVQARNQEWIAGNAALKVSSVTKKPVRVVRGYTRKKEYCKYAPAEGYRYDGLYVVERAWRDEGKRGFKICKFELRRLPHQPPLPGAETGTVVKPVSKPVAGPSRSPLSSAGPSKPAPTKRPPQIIVAPREPRGPRPPYQPSAEDIARLKASRIKSTSTHLNRKRLGNAKPIKRPYDADREVERLSFKKVRINDV